VFIPNLDDVENYHVEHLNNGTPYWQISRVLWTDHHTATLADYRGGGWEGQGADAALTRIGRDKATAFQAADTVQDAETAVRSEVGELTELKSEAMAAIDAARAAGFVVNQDFSLTDTAAVPVEQAPARRAQGEQLSGDIVAGVEALCDHDATVAARLDAHRGQLDTTRFADGKPVNGSTGVGAVPVDPKGHGLPRFRLYQA
jgi:hypothetical protein